MGHQEKRGGFHHGCEKMARFHLFSPFFVFFFARFAGTSGGSAPWHLARAGVRGSDLMGDEVLRSDIFYTSLNHET